jgi:hypothetical protein
MIVGDRDDENVIVLNGVEQLVGKPAQDQPPDIAALARTCQGLLADPVQRDRKLCAESLTQTWHLMLVVSPRLVELPAGFEREQHPHQVDPGTSSAGIPSALPAL